MGNKTLVGMSFKGARKPRGKPTPPPPVPPPPVPPSITSNGGGSTASIAITTAQTAVTTVTATGTIPITFSKSGANTSLFSLDSSTGVLALFAPQSAGIYNVTVIATNAGGIDSQTITLTVSSLDVAPTITSNGGGSTANISITTVQTSVTTVTATGTAPITFTKSGPDSALFSIGSTNGVLALLTTQPAGSYSVTVTAANMGGTDSQAITLAVSQAAVAPTITSNGGGSTAAISITAPQTAVTTVTATGTAPITYTRSGADAALFSIGSSTGVLALLTAQPAADYHVTVTATNTSGADSQDITLTVAAAIIAPTITSNGGGPTATIGITTSQTAVTLVTATGTAPITYSISGGTDAGLFTINASSGVLALLTTESVGAYQVIVQATNTAGHANQTITVNVSSVVSGIFPLLLGGGGQTTIIDYPTASSPMLIGTDVGGALKWSGSKWAQLIDTINFPSTDADPTTGKCLNGCYWIASAPSDPTRAYMLYGSFQNSGSYQPTYLFKTDNATAANPTWVRCAAQTGSPPISCDPNTGATKFGGPKMAVSPTNKNVVVFGVDPVGNTGSTAFMTTDGGATLIDLFANGLPKSINSIPTMGWAFDAAGTTIWCGVNGSGVYKSTNTGTSWSLVAGSSPDLRNGKLTPGGVYWNTQNDRLKIWRISGTTAADVTNGNGQIPGNADNVIIYPSDATKVALINQAGNLQWCTNATAAAGSVAFSGTTGYNFPGVPNTTNPTDIPWFAYLGYTLGTNGGTNINTGQTIMDPATPGKIWTVGGVGVWYTTTTSSYVFWNSQSLGLAELITNCIRKPPGHSVLIGCWDRPLWRVSNPDTYQSSYLPHYPTAINGSGPNGNAQPITGGWAIDWASSDPSFQVEVCNGLLNDNDDTCYSSDGGTTWQTFRETKTFPVVTKVGGCIAACSPSVIAMVFGNEGDMYQTQNGGTAWAIVSASNFKTSGGGSTGMQNAGPGITTGWGHAFSSVTCRVAADRVTANRMYSYNNQSSGLGGGFYFSNDGAQNWTRMIAGFLGAQGENEKLKTVPNLSGSHSTAGHFFYCDGTHGAHLWLSISGTATTSMIQVNGVGAVADYDFGAVKPGNDYPSVFMIGFVGGVYGVYRSDSSFSQWSAAATPGSVTWTLLTQSPLGSTDIINAIGGDPDTYGKYYLGGGNQAFYGT